jgi:hypothetical protein
MPPRSVHRRGSKIVITMSALTFFPLSNAAAGATTQQAEQEAIIGTWVLDLEKSDDARKKLQESMQPDGGASRRRGGAGGVILGGRGGFDGRGRRAREGPPPAFVNAWIDAVSEITLERDADALILRRQGQEPLSMIPDGRERAIETEHIDEPILRKVRWDDRDLIIETKLGDALRIEEKYELRREDNQVELRVETKISGDRIARDIKFRRVYSRDPGVPS